MSARGVVVSGAARLGPARSPPAATMSVPTALMKQPPIQSTAGAVPVRNEKGKSGGPGSAGRRAGTGAGAAGARGRDPR